MGDNVKNKKKDNPKRRPSAIPPAITAPCIELSGNREALVEGSRGVLEYSPSVVRVNTSSMIVTFSGRELNLRCISPSALIIDGFITDIGFTV